MAREEREEREYSRKRVVAIVEDFPPMRSYLDRLLPMMGFETRSFATAEAFLNVYYAQETDSLVRDGEDEIASEQIEWTCLLTDISLTEGNRKNPSPRQMDGLDLVRYLQFTDCAALPDETERPMVVQSFPEEPPLFDPSERIFRSRRSLPIIVTSGNILAGPEALAAGADIFLPKPINVQALSSALTRLVEIR